MATASPGSQRATAVDDVFQLQSDIARTVSNALTVRMATNDPASGGTRNIRAYEANSRGRALYNLARDEATDREAKALYEVAIAADPDFALAHAGLSRVLSSLAQAMPKRPRSSRCSPLRAKRRSGRSRLLRRLPKDIWRLVMRVSPDFSTCAARGGPMKKRAH